MVKEYCDSRTDSSLSREDNAFNIYCQAVWSDYDERDTNQYPSGADWDYGYAKQFYYEGGGNCYEHAAFVAFMLRYFGYNDAQAIPVNVLLKSGNWGEHCLAFVTNTDGRKCFCDSSLGANGWMLDSDSYTLQALDIGQDPAQFERANFEEVVKPSWV